MARSAGSLTFILAAPIFPERKHANQPTANGCWWGGRAGAGSARNRKLNAQFGCDKQLRLGQSEAADQLDEDIVDTLVVDVFGEMTDHALRGST
jgi:hypothetical protein